MLDLMVDLTKSTLTLGNSSSGTGPFFAPSVTHLFTQTPNSATLLPTQINQQLFDDLRDLQRQPKQLSGATPPSILALEQILAQKSCFPKSRDQLQLIWPGFRIFFPKIAKKMAKIENLPKVAKNER